MGLSSTDSLGRVAKVDANSEEVSKGLFRVCLEVDISKSLEMK